MYDNKGATSSNNETKNQLILDAQGSNKVLKKNHINKNNYLVQKEKHFNLNQLHRNQMNIHLVF